ncbi:MAG: signal peptidase I [Vicinamibacterales bacterium]
MVQQELHPEDEGREGNGDSRQPGADQAPAGVPEALTPVRAPWDVAQEAAADADRFALDPARFERERAPWDVQQEAAAEPVPGPEAAIMPAPADMRLELDDPTAAMMRRLAIWRDELVAWFKTLASAAVYATLIVTFGFQVARVEGLSMAPTLADQDRLIVNKFAYRIGAPRRGDIVMLYYPLNPDKSFVKRVIAEEGDTVRIVDGQVYVNDVPMRDDFVPPEYRSHDDFGPTVIPEGYYFVLGDHRNNSSDSRHWGFVPKKYIIGKVQLRWWPIPNAHVF